MDISLFPNPRPTNPPNDERRIKVNIISDGKTSSYIIDDLDKDKTLKDTRECLSSTEEILMGWQNSAFRNKLKRKIPLSQEDKYKLEDILVSEDDYYSLTIEMNQLPSFPKIKRQHNIEIGYKTLADGSIIAAEQRAFVIKNSHLMSITRSCNFDCICRMTVKNFDAIWIKSFEDGYGFSDNESECESESSALNECTIKYCEKGSIMLSCKDLEVTEDYIKAIEDALDEDLNDTQKIEALIEIGKTFGFFWVQEIKLGGKFIQVVTQNGERRNKTVGGDHAKHQNTSDWLKSLESCKEWEIIGYGTKLPLYLLLPEELQSRIKRLNGMKVRYSDVYSISIIRLPVIEPVPVPPSISNLKDCKIFATILNKADRKPYKNVFSIRIDYLNDETPFFVIHRIGIIPRNLPQIDLKIHWMIVGYENDLPIEPFLNNSFISNLWTKSQDDRNIPLRRPISQNHCWITTVTLHCNRVNRTNGYQFARSGAQISCHLSQSNDGMTINNETGGLICVIVDGPTNSHWRNRNRFLGHDRCLFTGRWHSDNNDNFQLPDEDDQDDLIFSSLLCPNHPGQGCNNLFLNINPKYPIIKSPNNMNSNPNCLVSYIILRKP
ncbi:7536_t:CDS:2 [Cetraspora pellucida]|uniref:7536_t:CDS:1 n=1 Tax=Cetraspora pellucida TaxID=1433469 RepID=A0A9N8ZHG7_9GLOM|nr:7536_t:CDS:2 [Cetraspora pellucida]